MKMELNNNGYWEINRGKTKIVVYPGSDRPYKPVSFTYNTDPPYNSPRYNVQSAVRDTLMREEGQTGVQSHIEYGTDERSE